MSRLRGSLQSLLILCLTVGLLALFLRHIDLRQAWHATLAAHQGWIGAAVVVTLQTYLMRAWRWQALLQPIGRARFRTAFRTTIIGFAASFLLPGRVGEVLRPYLLARTEGLNTGSTLATILVERMLDLCTVLLLFAAALFTTGVAVQPAVEVAGQVAALTSVLGLAILFVLAGHPERLGAWAGRVARHLPPHAAAAVGRFVRTFAEGLKVMRSPAHLAMAIVWSVPLWLSIGLGIVCTARAFELPLPLMGSFLVVGYLAVGVAVPTPGAAGGFHAAFLLAMTQFFDAPESVAGAAAIVLHLVSFIPVSLLGLLYMWQDGLTLGGLRGLKADAAASRGGAGNTDEGSTT